MYLDDAEPESFEFVLIPIFIGSGLHLFTCAVSKYRSTQKSSVPNKSLIDEVVINASLILVGLLLIIRLAVSEDLPAIVIAVPALLLFTFWIAGEIYSHNVKNAGYEQIPGESN